MRKTRRIQRRKRKRNIILLFLVVFLLLPGLVICGFYGASYIAGPPPLGNVQKTVYYTKDGDVLGEEQGTVKQAHVPLSQISKNVIEATIAVEDRNFYKHYGFDVKRIGGAILSDIRHLSLKEGASTLTQQLARNLYLSHEKTWTRKAKEAFYTTRLEMFYSKDEILEGYLNRIYYGLGAYGIEAASKYYLNKHDNNLTIAEAAMLAGIPKGPTYYSPFNNMERAVTRQKHILKLLYNDKYITYGEYEQAVSEQLAFSKSEKRKVEETGPYFQDMVEKEAANILNVDLETFRSGGYKVYTTIDPKMQKKLDKAIAEEFKQDTKMEVGAMAMDQRTGEVRALSGGRDYQQSTYNRAVSSIRMPGSTFKPFLYYAALERGYTASTPLASKPTSFKLADGKVYEPSNYNGYYANKPITLAQAIALSDNIYAVKTNIFLKPETLVKTARDFGITSKLAAVPSLALGTYEVSVKEMVSGYSMIANGGKRVQAHTVKKIEGPKGENLYKFNPGPPRQVLDRTKTFLLTHLMTGMFDTTLDGYMQVTGASVSDQLTHEYAAKSGSTNSDSWMIGFSPSLTFGLWTGYDDNQDIDNVAEMSYAKNIWANFMEGVHDPKKKQKFMVPAGVVPVKIDPETGMRATPYCKKSRIMYFEKGTAPKEHCTIHMHGGELPKEWLEAEDEPPIDPKQVEKEKRESEKKRKELFDKWKKWLE